MMRHPLPEQIAAMRRREIRRRSGALIFGIGVALLVAGALQAPLGWMPLP